MSYESSGDLTTDERQVGTSTSWDTQTEWEAYQSLNNLQIENGVVKLASALPDSVEYQFIASSTSSGSDWTSEDGTLTLSVAGSPTIQSAALNGEDTLYYDGADDRHRTTNISISQKDAIVAVYQYPTTGQGGSRAIGGTDSSSDRHFLDPDGPDGTFSMNAGSYLNSTTATDTNWHIQSGIFDGANSINRLDGSQIDSGDPGSNSLSDLNVAYSNSNGIYTELEVAEFWILTNPSEQDVIDSENQLNNKYAVY